MTAPMSSALRPSPFPAPRVASADRAARKTGRACRGNPALSAAAAKPAPRGSCTRPAARAPERPASSASAAANSARAAAKQRSQEEREGQRAARAQRPDEVGQLVGRDGRRRSRRWRRRAPRARRRSLRPGPRSASAVAIASSASRPRGQTGSRDQRKPEALRRRRTARRGGCSDSGVSAALRIVEENERGLPRPDLGQRGGRTGAEARPSRDGALRPFVPGRDAVDEFGVGKQAGIGRGAARRSRIGRSPARRRARGAPGARRRTPRKARGAPRDAGRRAAPPGPRRCPCAARRGSSAWR